MDFGSLTRLVGEVRRIAPAQRIIIFGSSSLLASFSDTPPERIGAELTLDVDFFLDPDDEQTRILLKDSLGKNRAHHSATGYYGDFVDIRLAQFFPPGWRERLVPMPGFANVFAIEPLDMAAAKLTATARSRLSRRLGGDMPDRGQKDTRTIVALLKAGLIARGDLHDRIFTMDVTPALTVECDQVLREVLQHADLP